MSAKKKAIGSVHKLPPSGTEKKSPYKGHISVKSNAYSATGCTRMINQYGVMDQMNVHYKKIHTAKSRIDSSVPKAWTTSVKKADQMKRQAMQKRAKSAMSRPSSRSSTPGVNGLETARTQDRDLTLQDLDLVDRLLEDSDEEEYNAKQRNPTRTNPSPKPARHRPSNALNNTYGSTKSGWGNNSQLGYTPRKGLSGTLNNNYRPMSAMSTDVIDKQPGRFTTPRKEHTPRTLRTNAQSRLAQSRNYNRPKTKTKERPSAEEDAYSEFSEEDIPLPAQDHIGLDENGEPCPGSPTPDETHDAVSTWVARHSRQGLNSTLGDIQEGYTLNQSHNSHTLGRTERRKAETPRRFSRKMEEQEEELRYLEFVTDVTNDVLNRGIFTNRVLKQVFETHIQLHKDQLEEGRMRDLMQQLQRDLQIPENDDDEYDSDER